MNEERMKNGGKPSRICSRKHLRSVTEAPRLGFSSRKQFFSPKTKSMHIDHSKASNREEKVPRYEGNQLLNAESEIKPIPQMYKTCSKEHCHQDTT